MVLQLAYVFLCCSPEEATSPAVISGLRVAQGLMVHVRVNRPNSCRAVLLSCKLQVEAAVTAQFSHRMNQETGVLISLPPVCEWPDLAQVFGALQRSSRCIC